HRMVNEAEKRFIMENRDIVATEKSSPPWNDFFKRFSFYAIAITPLATNFERPNPNTRSEIAPADKIKKNINNQGNELMLI
ncbi:hypothetical protein INO04_14790, partial [Staphylococcus aureus]|nr:hypothetical protein [Staphylococcus aureus]